MGFGKRKPKREKVEFEVVNALASRAIVQTTRGMLPSIRMVMVTSSDIELVVEMPYEVATEFLNQAISAHSTIAPALKVPRAHF